MDAESLEPNGDVPDISQFLSIDMAEGDASSLNLDEEVEGQPTNTEAVIFSETTLTPIFPITPQKKTFSQIFDRFGPTNGKYCPLCRKYFSKSKFSNHLRTHTGEKPYCCEICNRGFARSDKLRSHRRVHTGEKPFQCFCGKRFARNDQMKLHASGHNTSPIIRDILLEACKYKDKNKALNPSHILQCLHCPATFHSKYKLDRHMRTHTGDRPYKCKCDATFTRSEHLKKHQAGKNCPLGDEALNSIGPAIPLSVLHNAQPERTLKQEVDDLCSEESFQPPTTIKQEIDDSINKEVTKSVSIDDLLTEFAQSDNVQKYESSVSVRQGSTSGNKHLNDKKKKPLKDYKPFMCEFCNKVFSKGHKLNIHRRIHTGEKPYKCETCGKRFSRKDHLLKHMNVHLKYRNGTTVNKECIFEDFQNIFLENSIFNNIDIKKEIPEETSDETAVNIHQMLEDFANSKTFSEVQDGNLEKTIEKNNSIQSHLDLLDSLNNSSSRRRSLRASNLKLMKDGPFKCSVCCLSFASNAQLLFHARVHDNQAIYSCDICLRKFKVKKNYEAHILNHETQADVLSVSSDLEDARNKRAQCPQCGKWLVSQSSLEMHMHSHTGQKPHKCDLCEKFFVRKADMVRHRKAHTGESMYNCPACSASYTRRDKLALHVKKNHAHLAPQCDF